MRYFRVWPMFVFEKDSRSYLTEKKEIPDRPERTIKEFLKKFKTDSKLDG